MGIATMLSVILPLFVFMGAEIASRALLESVS